MHRAAGATEVIVSSAKRFAILHELRDEVEWDLPALVAKMSPVDLVLVEGYKREAIPKLEIYRVSVGEPLLHPYDEHVVAIASDERLQTRLPQFDLNAPQPIAEFILRHVGLA